MEFKKRHSSQARSHCQHLAAVHKMLKNSIEVPANAEAPGIECLFLNSIFYFLLTRHLKIPMRRPVIFFKNNLAIGTDYDLKS